MNKKILKVIVILLITGMVCTTAFATIQSKIDNKQNEFLKVDKTEACAGDYVTISIDLSKIKNEFELDLNSNTDLSEGILQNNNQNVSATITENKMVIISSKDSLGVDKITLYMKIPENVSVGSTIEITGTLKYTESESNVNNSTIQTNIKSNSTVSNNQITNSNQSNTIINNQSNSTVSNNQITNSNQSNTITNNQSNSTVSNSKTVNSNQKKIEESVEIKIVKQENQNEKLNENKIENANTRSNIVGQNVNLSDLKMINTNYENTTQLGLNKVSTLTSGQKSETGSSEMTTYQGSVNAYLTSISVDGYELNPEFSTTNTTYFINVENSVTKLSVSTEKFDDKEDVQIYGNTNFQVGENKILINVESESGVKRVYRIFVNRAE